MNVRQQAEEPGPQTRDPAREQRAAASAIPIHIFAHTQHRQNIETYTLTFIQ